MSLAKSILLSGLASQVPNPVSPATIKTIFLSPNPQVNAGCLSGMAWRWALVKGLAWDGASTRSLRLRKNIGVEAVKTDHNHLIAPRHSPVFRS